MAIRIHGRRKNCTPTNNPNSRPTLRSVSEEFKCKTPFKLGFHLPTDDPELTDWKQLYEGSLHNQVQRWPRLQKAHALKNKGEIITKAWERLDKGTEGPDGYEPRNIHQAIAHELNQYTVCM